MPAANPIINVFSWHWKVPEEEIPSFLRHEEKVEWLTVKNNQLRSIYRIRTQSGKEYFLKHDHPHSLLKRLKARLSNKCRNEFRSAELLEANRIPTVKYLGWGKCGADGMLVSEAASDTVSGKEYWHTIAAGDEALQRKFLADLTVFVHRFIEAGLYHPDFHLGNILAERQTGELIMVDPYGIRPARPLSPRQRLNMGKILVDLRGEIDNAEGGKLMSAAGLADPSSADPSWRLAVAAEEKEIADNWPRRVRQILSGRSKFSTAFVYENHTWHQRHTLWYRRLFSTTAFKPDPNWYRRELPHQEAEKIWLESFRHQMMRNHSSPCPILWEQGEDGRDTLYYHVTSEDAPS